MPTPEPGRHVPDPHAAPHAQRLRPPNLPRATRVRDRLEFVGPEGLSDHDLLSVLIGGPPPEQSERGATRLLRVFGSLRGLARATPRELHLLKGTGGAMSKRAALRLSAAFALGRRLAETPLQRGAKLANTKAIFDHFHDRLRDLRKERFLSVLLDGKNRVIREDLISEGCLTSSLVHPREVFAPAIRESANRIILIHNHPSGDPEPSPEDIDVTARLCAVGDLVGILVVDHLIIGDGRYVSLSERGYLPTTPA